MLSPRHWIFVYSLRPLCCCDLGLLFYSLNLFLGIDLFVNLIIFTLLEWLNFLHKPFSCFCVCFNVRAHVDFRMPSWSHFSPSTYFTFKLPGLPGKCFCALSYLASPSCVLCLGKQKTLCVHALLQVLHHYLFLGRHYLSKCDPVAAYLYGLHTTWSAVFYPSQKSETL